ncbi:hypothetical protein GGS23DRAFT_551432 [Durotheca rogersii]|uniref:uncharacterized protein n=1 Tax=Durotheca rogersii TaxID=419775 RepID=UPI00221E3DAD|nr:uncharacterized protein GGS23DRAFT_551432 [Durotheca rogersii]KAI5866649.1 hypothetical protein GGS23DRAFT_551432 [Durotheca rogersii]
MYTSARRLSCLFFCFFLFFPFPDAAASYRRRRDSESKCAEASGVGRDGRRDEWTRRHPAFISIIPVLILALIPPDRSRGRDCEEMTGVTRTRIGPTAEAKLPKENKMKTGKWRRRWL